MTLSLLFPPDKVLPEFTVTSVILGMSTGGYIWWCKTLIWG